MSFVKYFLFPLNICNRSARLMCMQWFCFHTFSKWRIKWRLRMKYSMNICLLWVLSLMKFSYIWVKNESVQILLLVFVLKWNSSLCLTRNSNETCSVSICKIEMKFIIQASIQNIWMTKTITKCWIFRRIFKIIFLYTTQPSLFINASVFVLEMW